MSFGADHHIASFPACLSMVVTIGVSMLCRYNKADLRNPFFVVYGKVRQMTHKQQSSTFSCMFLNWPFLLGQVVIKQAKKAKKEVSAFGETEEGSSKMMLIAAAVALLAIIALYVSSNP